MPISIGPLKLPELELLQKIGSGAYGEVWLCRNALGTLRAVKIVRLSEFDDPRPYEREFQGIKNFEPISRAHEGFVDILQVGRNDTEGYFYYVMELADSMTVVADVRRLTLNSKTEPVSPEKFETPDVVSYIPRTLASEAKSRGPLPIPEVLPIALTLAEALVELHRHNLVHRDIKPSNIIFVGGVPKLADIGLVSSATDSKSFVGTEGYIPPEGPGTIPADLYSLGIVLYVLATGKHHGDFPEPPSDLSTRQDQAQLLELTAIIHKATQTNPKDRYPSAKSLLDDLKYLQRGISVKRRHLLASALSWTWKIAAVLLLLIALVWAFRHERRQRAELVRQDATSFEGSGTTNFEAWEAFTRGKTLVNSFTPAGFSNGITHYERALEIDPTFGLAWANLAGVNFLLADKGFANGITHLERAIFCAKKALEFIPNSGRAFHWLANATLAYDYDFSRAEPMFRKAIELDPRDAPLAHNFAFILWFYGRFDEAESLLKKVLRMNPSYGYTHSVLGQIASSRGDYRKALKELDECVLLLPAGPDPYLERAIVHWIVGRKKEGADDLLRCLELSGFSAVLGDDPVLLHLRSEKLEPEIILGRIIEMLERKRTEGRFVSSFDLARLHALNGNKPRALDYLEQAVDEHRSFTLSANVQPAFDFLRNEERFAAVLKELKLVP